MALVFVAILIALVLSHYLPEASRLRNFDWLRSWQAQTAQPGNAPLGLAFAIGLPTLVCALVQWSLHGHVFGLPSFLFAIVVLFYCLGPRDLEHDVTAVDVAPDADARVAAAQALRDDDAAPALAFAPEPLIDATFDAALRRVFGVIFWFMLAGAFGALLYRLAQICARSRDSSEMQRELAQKFATALDWLPAHLIALALALAADFDAVFKAWRDYHAEHGKGYFTLDLGFLHAVAHASVDADIAAGDDHSVDAHSPLVALDDAMTLVRRALIVWLALLALVVIAGWFA